jgi:hypothetical protein
MPGTGLARDSPVLMRLLWLYVLPNLLFLLRRVIPATYTPDQSGRVLARLAMDDALVAAYWKHAGPSPSSTESHDVAKQDDLWNWTVQQVAENEAERAHFDALL